MKILLASFIIFLSAGVIGAQENKNDSRQSINIEPAFYRFGTISDKRTVDYYVTLHNTTDKIVHILKINAPCTCTIATPHIQSLSPGEKSKLKIIFNPIGRQGYMRWEINVYTDLQSNPIAIAFDASVLKDDYISDTVVYFGEFQRENRPEKKIWISPLDHPDFKIVDGYVDVSGQREYFIVQWQQTQYDGFYPRPRFAYCISITPHKDIKFGRIQGKLIIETDISGKEKIEIPIIAKALGEIATNRDYVAMGIITRERPVTKSVMVYNLKGKNFTIYPIRLSQSFLRASITEIIPGQYYEIQITGVAELNTPEGEFRGEIVVSTSSEEQRNIILTVQGFVKQK